MLPTCRYAWITPLATMTTTAPNAMGENLRTRASPSWGSGSRSTPTRSTVSPPIHTAIPPRWATVASNPIAAHRPVVPWPPMATSTNRASAVRTPTTRHACVRRRSSVASRPAPTSPSTTTRRPQARPELVRSTSHHWLGFSASVRARPDAYGACTAMATSPATTPTPSATHSTTRTRRLRAPAGHTTLRNTGPPTTTANAAYDKKRLTPRMAPALGLPPPWASRRLTRPGSRTTSPVPTWNVKAPWTGCESADTTRHDTT